MEKGAIPVPGSLRALSAILVKHSVDIARFGAGDANTVADLLCELREGECTLAIDGDVLTRFVRVAILRVELPDGRVLKEEYQEFHDGRRRRRELDGTAGEKLKGDESVLGALERLVVEELPFLLQYKENIRFLKTVVEEDGRQRSYPTLRTVYEKHIYSVLLATEFELPALLVCEGDKWVGYNFGKDQ